MENTLEITRHFKVPLEKVWAAWTNPEELEKWFGPQGMDTHVYKMDTTEGGEYRFGMRAQKGNEANMGEDKEHVCFGVIQKIDVQNHELQMTWGWENPEHDTVNTLVTVRLKEKEGGTEMHFTHSGFGNEGVQAEHNKGWTSSFVVLEKHLG